MYSASGLSLYGVEGEIDLEKEPWGEVFLLLKDKERFFEFILNEELETIVWPIGVDNAPEFLCQLLCSDL